MATKAAIFNAALIELGHRPLQDTGEAIEAGRLLNTVWDRVVNDCISVGSWNFAMETIEAAADTGVTPSFGYTEVFAKPADWVRTIGISLDEHFSYPLMQYYDDSNFWSADSTPIYVRYVSNDTGLGFDLARWPAAFTRFVELELASRVAFKITQSESLKERMDSERDKAKRAALNQDAMNEPQPKFAPPGGWSQARWGRLRSGDRGNRGSFTG